jgi:hypothetical protein
MYVWYNSDIFQGLKNKCSKTELSCSFTCFISKFASECFVVHNATYFKWFSKPCVIQSLTLISPLILHHVNGINSNVNIKLRHYVIQATLNYLGQTQFADSPWLFPPPPPLTRYVAKNSCTYLWKELGLPLF